jgi:hypothetical protein
MGARIRRDRPAYPNLLGTKGYVVVVVGLEEIDRFNAFENFQALMP